MTDDELYRRAAEEREAIVARYKTVQKGDGNADPNLTDRFGFIQ